VIKEEFGNVIDLHENFNGNQGNLVLLEDENMDEINRQWKQIKQGSAFVGYSIKGRKHCLLLLVAGIVKKKVIKRKSKFLGE
jgi:hypothetical protein